jgi:hypothetical protein
MSNLLVRQRLHFALPHPAAVVGYFRILPGKRESASAGDGWNSYDGATAFGQIEKPLFFATATRD